jgi:hypothetical protein
MPQPLPLREKVLNTEGIIIPADHALISVARYLLSVLPWQANPSGWSIHIHADGSRKIAGEVIVQKVEKTR